MSDLLQTLATIHLAIGIVLPPIVIIAILIYSVRHFLEEEKLRERLRRK